MVAVFDDRGTLVVMQVDRSGHSILEYVILDAAGGALTLRCRAASRALFGPLEGTTTTCVDARGAVDVLTAMFRKPMVP